MKKNMIFSLVFAFIISFGLIACNSDRTDDTMDDTTEMNDNTGTTGNVETPGQVGTTDDGTQVSFWDTNRDYTYEQRSDYQTEMDAAVEKLDQQIETLEDRADNATGENKQAIEQRIDQLKENRTEIKNKMNDWANITENEWDQFKSDMNTAWNDIQDSYDQIARDLGTDDENTDQQQ